MFFQKGRIRKAENAKLLATLAVVKEQLEKKQRLRTKSVDPSLTFLNELKIAEATYIFLLREARIRCTKINVKE